MENPSNKIIATLESKVDHLETELSFLDTLLKKVGFSEGIETLKLTAIELLNDASPFFN